MQPQLGSRNGLHHRVQSTHIRRGGVSAGALLRSGCQPAQGHPPLQQMAGPSPLGSTTPSSRTPGFQTRTINTAPLHVHAASPFVTHIPRPPMISPRVGQSADKSGFLWMCYSTPPLIRTPIIRNSGIRSGSLRNHLNFLYKLVRCFVVPLSRDPVFEVRGRRPRAEKTRCLKNPKRSKTPQTISEAPLFQTFPCPKSTVRLECRRCLSLRLSEPRLSHDI